eukprot:TRINITY_DN5797_c0_g1_i1.p1 TRINITY_DN5797_c0_g1~~TRINITY_DN5797_c0_g1_i1.p1  ORF type:complete len:141 (-),score=22.87 TRINITY_DN5797_c0_g1_i1:224-646(-)
MSAAQFYQFAWDAQLLDNSADVDNFCLMALGSHYRGALRVTPDRFNAALVRVFENLATQRGVDLARACDTLIRDHVTPIVADRAARAIAASAHAHYGAVAHGYGYGVPYGVPGFAGSAVSSRGPLRAAERQSTGRSPVRR